MIDRKEGVNLAHVLEVLVLDMLGVLDLLEVKTELMDGHINQFRHHNVSRHIVIYQKTSEDTLLIPGFII
jgi:hypothetical protein